MMRQNEPSAWPIPARLNMVLSLMAWSLAAACLWVASHGPSAWMKILAIFGFALVNNTTFSLLHESVHGVFHPDRRVNDAFGRVGAAFFPTAFTVQRACHLGHHRRNRTDSELFDYCPPGTPMSLARFRLGCLLTGFFWLSAPLGCVLYALGLFRLPLFRDRIAAFYGMRPMVEDVCRAPGPRILGEIVFTIAFQAALAWALDLTSTAWLACYGAFALLWCSVQYSTHAWTPRDIRDGAWNLRAGWLGDVVFLHYFSHLAHHRHPAVPWIHLPRLVEPDSPRPSWLAIYLSLWRDPRRTEEPDPQTPPPDLVVELERLA